MFEVVYSYDNLTIKSYIHMEVFSPVQYGGYYDAYIKKKMMFWDQSSFRLDLLFHFVSGFFLFRL